MSTEFGSTRYGFTWGPMQVQRLASFSRPKGGTAHVLGITTARDEIEVTVSRTGVIRVHRKGKGELK